MVSHGIFGLVLLDSEGSRIVSKYVRSEDTSALPSTLRSAADRRLAESQAHARIQASLGKSSGKEIYGGSEYVALSEQAGEVSVILFGSLRENEILLADVCHLFVTVLNNLTSSKLTRSSILDQIDKVQLVPDEIFDEEGILLETNPVLITSRIMGDVKKGETFVQTAEANATFNKALSAARDNLYKSFTSAM